MRILDVNNKEIFDPDLTKGYLKEETIILVHHPAIPETPATYERVEIKPGLYSKRVKTPWMPGKGEWDEKETIQRYIKYTPEELAQQEQERQEAEEEAKRAEEEARKQAEETARRNEMIDSIIPNHLSELEEGVAEVGVLAADAATSIDELMEAVAEIGVIVAEMQEDDKNEPTETEEEITE